MYDYYTSLPSVFPTFMSGFGQTFKLKYGYDAEMGESFGFPVFDSLDEEEVFWDDPKWYSIMDELRLITEAYDKGGPSLVDLKSKLWYFHSFGWGPEGKDHWTD